MKAFIITLSSMLFINGCYSPLEKPIIEDHARSPFFSRSKVNVFSTTAARREVLVKFPKDKGDPFICAESPPDTADALTSSLVTGAQVKANKGTQAEAEAAFNLARQIATSTNTLFTRSQGAQIFRDGAFHLCLALQNKVINEAQYLDLYIKLLDKAYILTLAEMPSLDAKKAETAAKNAAVSLEAAQRAAIRADEAQAEVKGELAKLKAASKEPPVEAPAAN